MVPRSAGGEKVDVLVMCDSAKILDQRFEMADERSAALGAEDDVQQVQSVGVGHMSTVDVAG